MVRRQLMLRRTMVTVVAVCLAMTFAGTALAQSLGCVVGVYADDMGTRSQMTPPYNSPGISDVFSIYVILFTEDFANAVAWSLNIEGLGTEIFQVDSFPYGNFLDTQPEGYRLGLGGCVLGFNHTPILLMRHDLQALFGTGPRLVTTGPNPLENEMSPIYSTCLSALVPCDTNSLEISLSPIGVESNSWGQVKALYHD
jgi:hypothetical protein